jgi:broad specificity phosphatase PhoE
VTAARLDLVRHGHVENPDRVVYGRLAGWHLSEDGRRQAAAVAERLRGRALARVYSSPLERALETAEVISKATGAPVVSDEALTESALGACWEGLSWAEVKATRRAQWEAYLHRPHEIDFVSETFAALGQRMASALRRIAAVGGGEAAVVSHGDPIKAALCTLTGVPIARMHGLRVPTGSLVVVELDGERAAILERWSPRRARVR